jgi:UDP-N-acetylmuramoyl-L-alanyl-D-glutamate--2,6-diaminopimelate ligase
MKLSELLRLAQLEASITSDPDISGVTHDSRLVKPGFAFVAIQGVPLPTRPPLNGHAFIPKALENGAVAVVGTKTLELPVPYIRVSNDRQALGDLSSAFWGFPARRLKIIGVTGSKGKSTTVTLIHHLLEHAGVRAARMSTVGIRYAGRDEILPGHFTTPEAPQVQELLKRFVDAGCDTAVLEVSSHALALERVRGISYDVGVWTNLEAEHLDFHGTMEAYFAEKRKLLERSRWKIINSDDDWGNRIPMLGNSYYYGTHGDWSFTQLAETAKGLEFKVISPFGDFDVRLPMIGTFNALNALAAMAAVSVIDGFDTNELQNGLSSFPGVPGRMQLIQTEPFRVINDFAHTENSVRAALETLRSTTPGRIILVVGAAGERGTERRTGIAGAAAEGADFTVFTEEDHRTESLDGILETMREAFVQAGGAAYRIEPDRREAIRWAVRNAKAGDTVLLAGKGHERTMERGTDAIPWDETAEARAALEG